MSFHFAYGKVKTAIFWLVAIAIEQIKTQELNSGTERRRSILGFCDNYKITPLVIGTGQ